MAPPDRSMAAAPPDHSMAAAPTFHFSGSLIQFSVTESTFYSSSNRTDITEK